MLKKIIILGLLFFIGCQSIKNENYLNGKEFFLNFDNVLSSEEYAKTIYFYKDKKGLWRNNEDALVNVNIPYKDDFFSFSNFFLNKNKGNEKGTNSRYISKYKNGVQYMLKYLYNYSGLRVLHGIHEAKMMRKKISKESIKWFPDKSKPKMVTETVLLALLDTVQG